MLSVPKSTVVDNMTDNKIFAYPAGECNANQERYYQFFLPPCKSQKPQIVSVSGLSPKERDRYRVVIGSEILGDRLTLDQAIKLVKRGVTR